MPSPNWDHIIVHCTATKPSQNFQAADIDRMHRKLGWRMCGYHEIITRSGQRQNNEGGFKTRPLTQAGAHVGDCGRGWNARSIGISLVGGVHETKKQGKQPAPEFNFTEAQIASLREAVAYYMKRFGIQKENVIGHRDLIRLTGAPPKDCPCFDATKLLFNIEPPGK